jgi:probable F420-dependent oxidoreductase
MPVATSRPFRFGAVFTGAYGAVEWAELARRLESEGFDTLLVADHYDNPMSCGPLLMAAASATTTLRVGSYVYNNDLRHPALLAKEAATIDVLSCGRLELGVGAGWNKSEYDTIGLPFEPGSVRASRFEEGIEIMTRLFTGEKLHFEGKHYRLSGLEGTPLPVQQPLPLLIGGGGPRMIRFAARKADILGFVPQSLPGGGLDPAMFAAAAMDTKVALLEAEVIAAGRTDGGPERSVLAFTFYNSMSDIPDDDWLPRDLVAESPYALIGDVAAIVDKIQERRERWGLTYHVCWDIDIEKLIPVVRKLAV